MAMARNIAAVIDGLTMQYRYVSVCNFKPGTCLVS